MKILALSTAHRHGEVALVEGERLLASRVADAERATENIFNAVQRVLAESNTTLSDLGLIAVSTGPGSFTGVRSGIAAALGLATGSGVSLAGMSSLFARVALKLHSPGIYAPVIEANARERFFAVYAVSAPDAIEELHPAAIVNRDELEPIVRRLVGGSVKFAVLDEPQAEGEAYWIARAVQVPLPDRLKHLRATAALYVKGANAKTLQERGLQPPCN